MKISVDSTSLKIKSLNRLLPLFSVQVRRYCKLDGDNTISIFNLPAATSSLFECFPGNPILVGMMVGNSLWSG